MADNPYNKLFPKGVTIPFRITVDHIRNGMGQITVFVSQGVRTFSTTADWFEKQGWQEGDRFEITMREEKLVFIKLHPVAVTDEEFAAMEHEIQK